MSSYLLLGPVLLREFELPERIAWGGAQRLAIHNLPGGIRVIDSLGRNDTNIRWSGIFTGADAVPRARALDLMRAGGGTWPLSWSSYFYSIVIESFEANYAHETWIPYHIACSVLADASESLADAAVSLSADVLTDVATAAGFSTGLDLSVSQSLLAVSGATTLGTVAYGAAIASLQQQTAAAQTAVATVGSAVLAAQPGTAVGLSAAAGAAGSLAAAASAAAFLGRATANLSNATS
jgi:hypothetical protein